MNSKFSIFLILILFFIIINHKLALADNNTQRNIQINDIIVKNNQRIDTETILSYLNLNSGDRINYEILNRRLKEMYKLGLFADIKFRVSGNTLIVLIKENPMINNIEFIGNKKFHDSHKSNLLNKDFDYYKKFDWSVERGMLYYWPVHLNRVIIRF